VKPLSLERLRQEGDAFNTEISREYYLALSGNKPSAELRRSRSGQRPSVQKTMQRGRSEQGRRESVQARGAVIMFMCVRTRRAERIDVTIDDRQRRASRRDP